MKEVRTKAGSSEVCRRSELKQALLKFAGGQDVLVSLRTGFGKSLCYMLLPRTVDLLRGVENKCVAIGFTTNSFDEKSNNINH